jgi:MFS transporter, PHS family, inorganic phosphate transporter
MAPTPLRGQMLTAVFACQPMGQVAATLVAMIGVFAARHSIPSDATPSTCTGDCLRSVDIIWRVVIGFGALLAAAAVWLRLTIIESPRYTCEVAQDDLRAAVEVDCYYQGSPSTVEVESSDTESERDAEPRSPASSSTDLREEDRIQQNPYPNIEEVHPRQETAHNVQPTVLNMRAGPMDRVVMPDSATYTDTGVEPTAEGTGRNRQPSVSTTRVGPTEQLGHMENEHRIWDDPGNNFWGTFWRSFKDYYWHQGNLRTLFATALCWGFLDLPFYGLGTSDPQIIRRIWSGSPIPEGRIYTALLQNAWQSLLMVQAGAIVGVLITLCSINLLGRRMIQMNGFFWLFVLFIAIGASYKHLLSTNRSSAIVVLYILCQVFFNFGECMRCSILTTCLHCCSTGPNTTTYIV